MNTSRRQSGFTLLELILALSIICMVSLVLYSSLRIAFKARDGAARAVAPMRAASVAMDLIRQDLENALQPARYRMFGPFRTSPNSSQSGTSSPMLTDAFIGQPSVTGDGTSDYLQLFRIGSAEPSDSVDPIDAGGIHKVEFSVETAEDGTTPMLVRHVTRNLLSPQVVEPDAEVICRGVRTFSLSYFDGDDWYDSWDSISMSDTVLSSGKMYSTVYNFLPAAVQVTLELDVSDRPAQAEKSTYRVVRIFTLPCYFDKKIPGKGGTS